MPRATGRLLVSALFLLWLCAAASAQHEFPFDISPSPGSYGRNTRVELKLDDQRTNRNLAYGTLEYRFAESEERVFSTYSEPIHLTALPGEERKFSIEIRRKAAPPESETGEREIFTVSYSIDKRPPLPPDLNARYRNGSLNLQIGSAGSSDTNEDTLFYFWSSLSSDRSENGIGTPSRDSFQPLYGERSLQIPWPNDIFACDIAVYAEDRHGNRSEIVEQTITRDAYIPSCDTTLRVMSPVEGRFANPQWLVVAPSGCFDWIRYSIDGSDPVSDGVEYHRPMLLRVRGEFTLRVAAKRADDGEILRETRDFSIRTDAAELSLSIPEMVNEAKAEIAAPEVDGYRFFYSFEDRRVGQDDRKFVEPIRLDMSSPAFHGVPLRVAVLNEKTGELQQYRYFYHLDNRKPSAPVIVVVGKTPFRESVKAYVFSRKNTDIYYTTDGSTPDRFSREYSGPLTITPPGGADTGSVTLRTIARAKNGRTSEVSSRVVLYDNDEPSKPEILIDESGSRRLVLRINAPEETERLRYELKYGKDASEDFEVATSSPIGKRGMVLEFPRGFAGRAVIRAAVEDDAGNLSAPSEPVSFQSDSVPPAEPKIQVREVESADEEGNIVGEQMRVEIGGAAEAGIRYALVSTSSPEEELDTDSSEIEFDEYKGPFILTTEMIPFRAFKVFAFAVDESGNRSAIAETNRFVLDDRRAEEILYFGIEDGEHYHRSRVLHIQSPQKGSVIHYRIGEGSQPEEVPDATSPVVDGPLLFSAEEGEETDYVISARAYLPSADSWSETKTLRFYMDRNAPEAPRISSPSSGGIYTSPVSVDIENAAEDEQVWLLWGSPGEYSDDLGAEDIRNKGAPLQESLRIGPVDGKRKDYVLYAAAFDHAGNSALAESAVEFAVDRDPPELVPLVGAPESGVAPGPVVLSLPAEEQKRKPLPDIVYSIAVGDREPGIPGRNASTLTLPFTFQAREGALTDYTMLYRSIDEAGNVSKDVGRLVFSIDDREVPPPEIRVEQMRSSTARLTLVSPNEEYELSYGVNGEPETSYNGPVMLELSDTGSDSRKLRISARAESSGGRRSQIVRKELSVDESPSAYVSGIENRKVYNRDIHVKPLGESIRYELISVPHDRVEPDGTYPRVSAFSPELKEEISLTVADGRTVHYLLSVGEVDPETGERLHSENFFLTIDKTVPDPPRFRGIGDGGYFTEIPEIRLYTEQNERAFVKVSKEGEEEATYREAPEALSLSTDPGEIHKYTIRAYTVDEAGNKSETVTKRLTVDRAVVYVAPNGKDAFQGSRGEPFASLERALYETRTTERSTIYLASGSYTVEKPIELEESALSIRGGFSHRTWSTGGRETVIRAGEGFPHDSPLIELRNGRFSCGDLILTNASLSAPLIHQRGRDSEVTMEKTKLIHSERVHAALLDLSDGTFTLRSSSIDFDLVSNRELIRVDGARLLLEESEIAGGSSRNDLSLIKAEGGTVQLKNSTIEPGSARNITTLFSEDSHVEIVGTNLRAGRGIARSYALRLVGGRCNISESELWSHPESRISFGINSSDSVVDIRDSSLQLGAESGTVAIASKGGRIDLRSTKIESAATSEFIYLLRGESAEMNVLDTTMKASESSDVNVIETRDADVMIKDSRLQLSNRSRSIRGIAVEDGTILDLIENDIAFFDFAYGDTSEAAAAEAGTGSDHAAIEEKSASDMLLRGNRFAGVETILITSEGERRESIEELEKERPPFDVKNPHSGNRVVPIDELISR